MPGFLLIDWSCLWEDIYYTLFFEEFLLPDCLGLDSSDDYLVAVWWNISYLICCLSCVYKSILSIELAPFTHDHYWAVRENAQYFKKILFLLWSLSIIRYYFQDLMLFCKVHFPVVVSLVSLPDIHKVHQAVHDKILGFLFLKTLDFFRRILV
jgi:hypothetical protein